MSRYRLIGGPLDGAVVAASGDATVYVVSNLCGRWYVECWYWPGPDGTALFVRSAETDHVTPGVTYVERDVLPLG